MSVFFFFLLGFRIISVISTLVKRPISILRLLQTKIQDILSYPISQIQIQLGAYLIILKKKRIEKKGYLLTRLWGAPRPVGVPTPPAGPPAPLVGGPPPEPGVAGPPPLGVGAPPLLPLSCGVVEWACCRAEAEGGRVPMAAAAAA